MAVLACCGLPIVVIVFLGLVREELVNEIAIAFLGITVALLSFIAISYSLIRRSRGELRCRKTRPLIRTPCAISKGKAGLIGTMKFPPEERSTFTTT